MKATTNNTITYRPEIDGLRAVAVIPVIIFHGAFGVFSGGFVGVDVFFVISGYLITSILLRELQTGDFSIIRFYERRARRILPALFIVLISCFPFIWIFGLPEELRDFGRSLFAVVIFSSNIYFWLKSDYFSPSSEEMPLLHTWSLAVEEQYYVIFPILLWFVWRYWQKYLPTLLIGMTASSLLLSEIGWRIFPLANFYLLPTRAWELLTGSCMALLLTTDIKYFSNFRGVIPKSALAGLGLLMIILSSLIFDKNTPFPSIYTLIPVLGTALVIHFSTSNCPTGRLLACRPFVAIGLISYSAYLWHQPLFAFARLQSLTEPTDVTMLLLVAASLLLAYLSWRFVEAPFRQPQITSKKLIFTYSACGLFVFGALGILLHLYFNIRAQGTLYEKFISEEGTVSANYGIENSNCPNSRETPPFCSTTTEAQILLWGDSFATHLAQFFQESDLGLIQATMSSCFPNATLTPYENILDYDKNWAKRCHDFNRQVFEFAINNDNLKYIVISSTYTWPLKYNVYDGTSFRKVEYEEYLSSFQNDFIKLRDAGKKIVLFSPTPQSGGTFNFLKCAKKLLLSTPIESGLTEVKTDECLFTSKAFEVEKFLDDISRQADVPVINLNNFLCNEKSICSPYLNGYPVYKDWGHLTPWGSRQLEDNFHISDIMLKTAR